MEEIVNFDTVAKYNEYGSRSTLHPLISVVDLSKAKRSRIKRMNMGIYAAIFKDADCGELKYGRKTYDYEAGTMIFFAPGQVVSANHDEEDYQPTGLALVFHADLLRGTALSQHIHEYTFFSYQASEALHLSEREKQTLMDCLTKIGSELEHATDKHSKKLIVANLELFLDYCLRFYDRQFIMRDQENQGVLERFESLLNDYFVSDKPQKLGLPLVGYCAEQLNLSANYFGDLVKKETGKSAQEYIQAKLIEVAKDKIFDPDKMVHDVAYELGFKYPQHFTRFFKQHVGQSPNEYRNLN